MTIKAATTKASATDHVTNPWGSSLDKLKEWDPKGAELLLRVERTRGPAAFCRAKKWS